MSIVDVQPRRLLAVLSTYDDSTSTHNSRASASAVYMFLPLYRACTHPNKKTMVSCKCLHTTKLQIEAIVVKNTPAAAADDNPGLPRLVFSVRFKFFGPFQATPARSVPEQGFDELQTTSTELQRRSTGCCGRVF